MGIIIIPSQQTDGGLAANPAVIAEVGMASYPELHVYPARDSNKIWESMLALVERGIKE